MRFEEIILAYSYGPTKRLGCYILFEKKKWGKRKTSNMLAFVTLTVMPAASTPNVYTFMELEALPFH